MTRSVNDLTFLFILSWMKAHQSQQDWTALYPRRCVPLSISYCFSVLASWSTCYFPSPRLLRWLFMHFSSRDWITTVCIWQIHPGMHSGHITLMLCLPHIHSDQNFKTETSWQSWKNTYKARSVGIFVAFPLKQDVSLDRTPLSHQASSLYWHLLNITQRSRR